MVSASDEVARREEDTGTGTLVEYGLSAAALAGRLRTADTSRQLRLSSCSCGCPPLGAAVGRRGRAQPRLHTIIQHFTPSVCSSPRRNHPLGGERGLPGYPRKCQRMISLPCCRALGTLFFPPPSLQAYPPSHDPIDPRGPRCGKPLAQRVMNSWTPTRRINSSS